MLNTLIIGGGPAGTGPLVCAAQHGRLDELLDSGVTIVDRTGELGQGQIGQYVVNSDTLGGTFLECLNGRAAPTFASVAQSAARAELEPLRSGAVPLPLVGAYMRELGQALQRVLDAHPRSSFLPFTTADQVTLRSDGSFLTTLTTRRVGQQDSPILSRTDVASRTVVMAVGGHQNYDRTLRAEIAPGVNLAGRYAGKVMFTSHLLTEPGIAEMRRRLSGVDPARRKVVIVGASHSAFSTAWVLLNKMPELRFGPGDISMLYRAHPKVFYPSREAALAEGYTDFGDQDICPLTQRVYRLAGLRLDSRDLLRRMLGLGGLPREERVKLLPLAGEGAIGPQALIDALDQTAVIVPAFGYEPGAVDVIGPDGAPIALSARKPGGLLVDGACTVTDANGKPISGLFGIGLASGFKIAGPLGGEPSFTGQTNGLWLYQNGVGEIILDQLLPR